MGRVWEEYGKSERGERSETGVMVVLSFVGF